MRKSRLTSPKRAFLGLLPLATLSFAACAESEPALPIKDGRLPSEVCVHILALSNEAEIILDKKVLDFASNGVDIGDDLDTFKQLGKEVMQDRERVDVDSAYEIGSEVDRDVARIYASMTDSANYALDEMHDGFFYYASIGVDNVGSLGSELLTTGACSSDS